MKGLVRQAPGTAGRREGWIRSTRALGMGLAFYAARNLPGAASLLVALLAAFLAHDLFVSLPRLRAGLADWLALPRELVPRLNETVMSLAKGLAAGVLAKLAVDAGLSAGIGAAGGIGLGYLLAEPAKENLWGLIGLAGTLAVIEQMPLIPSVEGRGGEDWIAAGLLAAYGTLAGLFLGWAAGGSAGILARAFLPPRSRGRGRVEAI